MKSILFGSALMLILGGGLAVLASAEKGNGPLPSFVDPDGTIHFPGRVRNEWIHLGSWGPADLESQDPAQHDVYTKPETVTAFQKTGMFPDGAVLIKELRKIKSGTMTTGHVTWAGDEILWFVLIKDTKGRFPGNPNWGKGWGWALFNAGATDKNASTNFQKDCLGCHIPAQETDWIYIQGYPSLRAVDESPPTP
jgi:cytochrome c